MTEWPLVSIITPTYNRAGDYLRETVESVLAQDYPNFEYLVLDDGSSDQTRQLMASLDDPRLKYEYHDNMGVVKTVNKGFRMAQGEFITVVNSDDPVLPGLVRESAAFLQQHPDILACYPDWDMIDQNGQLTRHIQTYPYSQTDMVRWSHCVPGPGTFLRRRALELEPEYSLDYPYTFDHEYYMRLSLHGPMGRLPKTLATHRMHPGTITSKDRGAAMAAERIRMFEWYFNQAGLPPEVQSVKREAFATANLISALQCRADNPRQAGRYYLDSYLWHPFKCDPNGPLLPTRRKLSDGIKFILMYILPDPILIPLRKVRRLYTRSYYKLRQVLRQA